MPVISSFNQCREINMATTKSNRIYGFVVLCLSVFFVFFHRLSTAVLAPDLINEFSTSTIELGILSSMYFWSYAAMQIPSGFLIDSIGPRKTVTIFSGITTIGAILFGSSQTLLMASIARLFVGMGVSVIFVATIKHLSSWFQPDEMSSYFGVFILAGNLGAIGASAPLVFVTNQIGWRLTFGLLAIIAALLSGLAWVVIRDAPSQKKKHNNNTKPISRRSQLSVFKTIIRNRQITKVSIMMFLEFGILIAFQGLWGIPYLIDVYQMTQVEASYLITTLAIGICISAPLFGYLSDRVLRARKPIVRLGIVLFTVMWIPLAFKTPDLSKGLLYLIYFGLGFFHGALPVSITMVQEITEKDKVGITLGYTNSYLILGIAVFQPLIGWIITVMDPSSSSSSNVSNSTLGYATAFQLCFFCLVIASIIGFTLKETYSGSE